MIVRFGACLIVCGALSLTSGAQSQSVTRACTPDTPIFSSPYCAELVAGTYQAMGLLRPNRPANWYDAGRFWSGDDLTLEGGATLGAEIPVTA